MAESKSSTPSISSTDKPAINSEQQNIIDWLKKVRFRKQLFGGVSEQDVWKKIDEAGEESVDATCDGYGGIPWWGR